MGVVEGGDNELDVWNESDAGGGVCRAKELLYMRITNHVTRT